MRKILFIILIAMLLSGVIPAFAAQKEDIKSILQEIESYAEGDPSIIAGAVFSLADAYVRQKKTTEAIAVYEKALGVIPDSEELLNRLGNLYNQTSAYEKAVPVYEKLTKIRPGNTWYFQMLSVSYNMSGQKDKASAIWKELVSKNPNNTEIMAQAVDFYSSAKDLASAIPLMEKVVQLDPKNVRYAQKLAVLYAQTEEFDKAEEAYKKILTMAENEWLKDWANAEITNIYQKQGRLDELEAIFKSELKSVSHYYRLGELYIRKGENEKALDVFEKAHVMCPDCRNVNDRLVDLYQALDIFDKAVTQLEKMIEIAPDDLSLYLKYGEALRRQGNIDDAVIQFKKVIAEADEEGLKTDARRRLKEIAPENAVLEDKPKPLLKEGSKEEFKTDTPEKKKRFGIFGR